MPKDRSTRLTKRELATVLAALRYWQRDLSTHTTFANSEHFYNSITTPLTDEEIDELCERLNAMKGH